VASRRRQIVIRDLDRFVERAMRRLQLRVFQVLVVETPVLTGFARAGWSPSTGSPKPGPADSALAGTGQPRERLEDLARQQAAALLGKNRKAAEAIAQGYRLKQGAVFIVNNVRYVTYLNEGTSAQAPAKFVEMAITTAVRATQRELRASGSSRR
jgi:hypothetical protein